MTMRRILIDLSDTQIEELTTLAQRERRPRAAIIREAIGAYLSDGRQAQASNVFGLWKHRGIDGLRYQKELRSEW
jgi:metal-responsive CopG/Arc/MetJ family transcriptional regulator